MNKTSDTQHPRCWICGAVADSREHRIKKSDLMRHYDRGPYRKEQARRPAHVANGAVTEPQGPNAEQMKYAPSLCKLCNSTGTQDFDLAYDQFMEWLHNNEAEIIRRRLIDFFDVFGVDFPRGQLNLFKYYVKSFGCRIVDAGLIVPSDLSLLLSLEHFQTKLKISFSINETVLLMPKRHRDGWIGKGELEGWLIPEDKKVVDSIKWNEYWSWFTVNFWYSRNVEGPLGAPWIADSQYVYLGSHKPLSDEDALETLRPLLGDEGVEENDGMNCSN